VVAAVTPRGLLRLETPVPAEEWLLRYDRRPRLVPTWPLTPSMTVTVVRDISTPADPVATEGYVVLDRLAMTEAADPGGRQRELFQAARHRDVLFFTVPTSVLIRAGVAPGLEERLARAGQ